MSETGVQMVFCTFPDLETARQIGTTLVGRQLAKCVNLISSVESIYAWKGEIERGSEALAIFKIAEADYAAFERVLTEIHPYDVPEVLALEVPQGAPGYLGWVLGQP